MALLAFQPCAFNFPLGAEEFLSRAFDDALCCLYLSSTSRSPLTKMVADGKAEKVGVIDDEDEIHITMNVSVYSSGELIATIEGNQLSIEGRHKPQIDEYGSIQRHFVQTFNMPKDAILESTECELFDTGILYIRVKKKAKEQTNRKEIPIRKTTTQDVLKNAAIILAHPVTTDKVQQL